MGWKKQTLLASVIVEAIMAVALNRVRSESADQDHQKEVAPVGAETQAAPPTSMIVQVPASPAVAINPWDYHKPLTADERREFEGVEAQVRKFLTWGKMDPEAVPAFRQTLFKLGDRAIAGLAREISQISRDDLQDRAAAEEVVHKIDALAYFADSTNPLAADAIAVMAKRPVNWNDAGQLLNPVEANITLEMFDLFAKFRPTEAVAYISSIEKKHRQAYFTHYAYGRKLAGKTMEQIDIELRAVFGSPELALK